MRPHAPHLYQTQAGGVRQTVTGTLIFGGADDDEAAAAAFFAQGLFAIHVVGTTRRAPTEPGYHGGKSDGFLAVITSSQYGLGMNSYTYLGGAGEDRLNGVSLSAGGAYVAVGTTDSPDLATAGEPQTSLAGGRDAFYARTGVQGIPQYGYLGGTGGDSATSVSWVFTNQFLIAGETRSPDLPARAESSAAPGGGSEGFFERHRHLEGYLPQQGPALAEHQSGWARNRIGESAGLGTVRVNLRADRAERATPVLMPGKGEWWQAQGECWNAGLRWLATRDAPFELGRFRLNGFNLERASTG